MPKATDPQMRLLMLRRTKDEQVRQLIKKSARDAGIKLPKELPEEPKKFGIGEQTTTGHRAALLRQKARKEKRMARETEFRETKQQFMESHSQKLMKLQSPDPEFSKEERQKLLKDAKEELRRFDIQQKEQVKKKLGKMEIS